MTFLALFQTLSKAVPSAAAMCHMLMEEMCHVLVEAFALMISMFWSGASLSHVYWSGCFFCFMRAHIL